MAEVREKEVYDALLQYQGYGSAMMNNNEIKISLTPEDVHHIGRPDCILWVEITFRIFDQHLRIKVPMPIEAEKNGISDAMEDLEGFVNKKKYITEIPMIVVAESGFEKLDEPNTRSIPAKFHIRQVPIWQVNQKRK